VSPYIGIQHIGNDTYNTQITYFGLKPDLYDPRTQTLIVYLIDRPTYLSI